MPNLLPRNEQLNLVSQNGHMLAIATLTIDVARSFERFQHSSNLMISDSLLFRLSKIKADLSFYRLVNFGYYTQKLKKKEDPFFGPTKDLHLFWSTEAVNR